MKKTLLAILLGVSILTLGGCGSKETAGETSTDVGQELVEETAEVVEEATGTEEQAEDVEEQEEVVEEETLGVPAGTIPDYAKDWQEGDRIQYDPNSTENSDLTGLTPVQENHWTSGVVTVNGETIKLGTTLGELEAAGYDMTEARDDASSRFSCCDVDINGCKVTLDFESDTDVDIDELPVVCVTVEIDSALGAEVCNIILGDDYSKYVSLVSDKFYVRDFTGSHTSYDYDSEDLQYSMKVTCDPYNSSRIMIGTHDFV